MNYKKVLGAVSAALMIVIAITLILVSGAWAASNFKTLHGFTGGNDGRDPSGALIFDQAGNLYSTTQGGGSGSGTIFELTPNQDGSWTETVLYSFAGGEDGARPFASLIFDSAGNLYGTTYEGGKDGAGTIFELSPNQDGSWTETVLHSFNRADGGGPTAGLVFDSEGNLYGPTTQGGEQGAGTIFQLTPNSNGSWTESVIHSFNGKDGSYPDHGGLIFDADGNLYGTANAGGADGYGVVFKLTPNANGTWTEAVLHNFTGANDGGGPESTLIFDKSGNLYGTTRDGGAHRVGVAFELTPKTGGTWTETVLHQFTGGKDGAAPYEGVIFDQAGNLYGTAEKGGNLSACGSQGCGVVFKLAPNSKGGWSETVLHAFADHPGAFPNGALIFDGSGNLYGTTEGIFYRFGSVFEITP
jgi:uncharacterized repeat protein (TIGR03803 family)